MFIRVKNTKRTWRW